MKLNPKHSWLPFVVALVLSACTQDKNPMSTGANTDDPGPAKQPFRKYINVTRNYVGTESYEFIGFTSDSDSTLGEGYYTYHNELDQLPSNIGIEVTGPNGLSSYNTTNADTIYSYKPASNYRISGAGFWTKPGANKPTTLFFTVKRLGDPIAWQKPPAVLYQGRNGLSSSPNNIPWLHLTPSFRIPRTTGVPHYTMTGYAPSMTLIGARYTAFGPQGTFMIGTTGPVTQIIPENSASFSYAVLNGNNLVTTVRPN